jgi:hypothetical protein
MGGIIEIGRVGVERIRAGPHDPGVGGTKGTARRTGQFQVYYLLYYRTEAPSARPGGPYKILWSY